MAKNDEPKTKITPISRQVAADRKKAARRLYQLTDLGNASRFAVAFADRLRYVHASHKWFIWSGSFWRQDSTSEVERLAAKSAKDLLASVDSVPPEEQDAIRDWALYSQSERAIHACLSLAKSAKTIAVEASAFDQKPMLLNTPTGTVDLKTGRLLEADRLNLIAQHTGTYFDPSAKADRWERFISEICSDNHEQAKFLQRALGYSATGDMSDEVFFLCWGVGSNGKSKFIETIRWVLGTYAKTTDANTFIHLPIDRVPNDLAALVGARLVVVPEIQRGQRLNEERIKRWTGRDSLSARFLHAEFFEFQPEGKLWMTANAHPRIDDASTGMWRRVRFIPFLRNFEEEGIADKTLPDKLRAEGPGILRWIVEGAQMWYEQGLCPPSTVTEASADYQSEQDPVGSFIASSCYLSPTSREPTKSLFEAYVRYCAGNALEPISKTSFGLTLGERGFRQDRTKAARFWIGLSVQQATGDDE